MSSSFYNLNNGGTIPTPSDSVSANPTAQDNSSFYNVSNPTPEAVVSAEVLLGQVNAALATAVAAETTTAANAAAAAASEANALSYKNTAVSEAAAAAVSEANALAYKNAAGVSETNAAASEASALTYKNAAATSATNAATSEANALTYKNAAQTSATNAATSETNAAASAAAAAATLANALVKTNNLSDLTNAATARTNLGLAAIAASGSASDLGSGTVPAARLPNPSAGALGGIQSNAGSANQWIASINTDGTVTLSQPGFSNLSGSIATGQIAGATITTSLGYTPANKAGDTFTGAVSFDSGITCTMQVASSVTDLSKHLNLYGNSYGFCITGSRLNYNVPTGAGHLFLVNGVDIATVNVNGIMTPASTYWNFGTTQGSSGYGIRDNAGTVEIKTSGDAWYPMVRKYESSLINLSGVSNYLVSNVPAWVRRITITMHYWKLSGSAHPMVQIGDSGGIEDTSYNSSAQLLQGGTTSWQANSTVGFLCGYSGSTSNIIDGVVVLERVSNTDHWYIHGTHMLENNAAAAGYAAGRKALTTALTQFRVISNNGTDTFNASSYFGYVYEG